MGKELVLLQGKDFLIELSVPLYYAQFPLLSIVCMTNDFECSLILPLPRSFQ